MGTGQVDSPRIVRICGALDCDKPVGNDGRWRYCSQACADKMARLQYKQRLVREIEKRRTSKVCALEGCNDPVIPPRRLYSSDACAYKAQRKQVQKNNEKLLSSRQGSSNSKHERHNQEIRTIRGMQHVPVEQWGRYVFVK